MKLALVLIHGWGQSPQCWQALGCSDAITLSLPGHAGAAQALVDDWVDVLLAQLPPSPVCLVGWSLGGQLAMKITLRIPKRVKSLVLIGSTPCFMQRNDWPHGVTPAAWGTYQKGVLLAPDKVLRRFRALMFKGSKRSAHDASIHSSRTTTEGLSAGLRLLKDGDLRCKISSIQCPVYLLHGTDDAVTPLASAQFLADHLTHVHVFFLAGASHALPWTHPKNIATAIAQAREEP
ncbi:MAG: alpha/beta fold hydrolase [Mariprofundaceae bacterium]|nr:alpha/beta fold hydrolase [Mariprofundaceae bacterium]